MANFICWGQIDMDKQGFDKIVEERITKIKKVLESKGEEYSHLEIIDEDRAKEDRLHQFKKAGEILECTAERALMGMKIKHDVSVYNMIKMLENGILPSEEKIDEKIGDSINYLILLEALLKERLNVNIDSATRVTKGIQ